MPCHCTNSLHRLLSSSQSPLAIFCAGVHEIAELFKDLANMTIEQGTILDRIDNELDVTLENAKQVLSCTRVIIACSSLADEVCRMLRAVGYGRACQS